MSEGAAAGAPGVVVVAAAVEDVDEPGAAGVVGGTDVAAGVAGTAAAAGAFLACQHEERTSAAIAL